MPELPEVAAHAERLHARYAGAMLARFEPLSFTALKTYDPRPEAAVGKAVESVRHRGKHLLLGFGCATFVVHLMQGGRLREDPKAANRPRGGVARWVFAENAPHAPLLLTEAGTEHKAGVWMVAGDPLTQLPLDGLGPEAGSVDDWQLVELLREHPARLHTFLRDQRVIAGLGRRLANEVCHRAKLSPFAATTKLTDAQAGAVVDAIRDALAEGLAVEREREDMSASKERPGNVHHRVGGACPVCGDTIRAVTYRSYEIAYCPTCQTNGKTLADNTTSKFLK